MGRMLGAFDNPQELDRPDLNKCPDCECYFAGDNCPLCGKECPEEMRAGNRKPPKKEKKRRTSSNRVMFIEWYHSWWFIALAMFIFPILGIVLLITSPHKKSAKITFVILGVIYFIISSIGIGAIIGGFTELFDPPVNTSLTREEYMAKCEQSNAWDIWHNPEEYKDKYVKLELTVKDQVQNIDTYSSAEKYTSYYVCLTEDLNGYILVRNCIQSGISNFAPGDVITVFGEGGGSVVIYDYNYNEYSAPCINAAYAEMQDK